MKNHKQVLDNFTFPFKLHNFQEEAVNEAGDHWAVLVNAKIGYGKTVMGLAMSLYHSLEHDVDQILVLCPPILIDQWVDFVKEIPEIPSVMAYRGTPKERAAMKLDTSVIVMSYNIFRSEEGFQKVRDLARKYKLSIIGDEFSAKSLKSQTFKKIKLLVYRALRLQFQMKPYHNFIALNATPISDPSHVYNWVEVLSPGVYRSKKQFESIHVGKQDKWGRVTKWEETDLLASNMERVSYEPKAVLDMPDLVYSVIPYSLVQAHEDVYLDVEAAEFEALQEDKVELALNSLFSVLQRVVLVPDEFELDVRPAILDYLDTYLNQIGDEQTIIFTRHVRVSEMLNEYIKDSVAVYGGVSKKKREESFNRFKSGDAQILVANMDSAGVGLNLQFCRRAFLAEIPFRSDKLEQIVGRVWRQGQTETCFIHIPLAKNTVQYRIYYKLLKNDEDLCKVLRTKQQVRDFLEVK